MTDLSYDIRGGGPVLLIIPGGAGHPMGLGPLTDALVDRFTVVTYDPLGLAHGRLGLPVERDLYFSATKTLSAYADEARLHGAIRA